MSRHLHHDAGRSAALGAMARVLGMQQASCAPSGAGMAGAPMAASFVGAVACRGRPAGEVSQALVSAAAQAGPGTVRELAERACVGYAAARYTSSRLVSRGELVPVSAARPMVLAAVRSFWEEAVAEGDDDA